MRVDILTLFPEMCESVVSESILGRAREKGLVRLEGKEYVVKDGDIILFRFNV